MSGEHPLVSVLTPTWNRAGYLERVWRALHAQSYRNFEWIVADDGSDDDTRQVIRGLAARSDFRVVLIGASTHIGKARMDNEAVAVAQGELIIWNDSDDYLLPECLQKLVACWSAIAPTQRAETVAISALCQTAEGHILNTPPRQDVSDSTWNDMARSSHFQYDMLHLINAAMLKACRFPEVDFVVPESVVWSVLGHHRVRVLPQVLKIVEYRAPHAISFSSKQQYCRGRAHAMAVSEAAAGASGRPVVARLRKLVTFIRYCLHGELVPREQLRLWDTNSSRWLWAVMYPLGWLLATKDRMQRKVQYTHREFDAAAQVVRIEVEELRPAGLPVYRAAA